MSGPIRIYIGATDEQLVPARVLELSIRRTTVASLAIRVMGDLGPDVVPARLRARGHTSFTFQRYAIPALQRFAGRAVYLDSDMLVFQDVAALWHVPFDGAQVLCVPRPAGVGRDAQFSVLVLDCGALTWDVGALAASLDRGELRYRDVVQDLAIAERVASVLPAEWNSIEAFEAGRTALLHFTRVETQPWLSTANPLGAIWLRALFDAIDAGVLTHAEVVAHVARGHLRPSLLWQIDAREADPRAIPRDVQQRLDASFRIPRGRRASALARLAARARDTWSRWRAAGL